MSIPSTALTAAVTILYGMLLTLSLRSFADEIPQPDFKERPLEYVSRHEIAYRWDNNRLEQVEDILLIGDMSDKKLTFYIKTIGNNHHICNATGDAQKSGDHYLFAQKECRLQIKFDANKATVSDVAGHCQKYFCGMMGNLQGDFVKRRSKTPQGGDT